jgi:hypothetical protein
MAVGSPVASRDTLAVLSSAAGLGGRPQPFEAAPPERVDRGRLSNDGEAANNSSTNAQIPPVSGIKNWRRRSSGAKKRPILDHGGRIRSTRSRSWCVQGRLA